jgi:hypothetical protein
MQAACDKLFKEIIEDPNHKLHPLLPDLNSNTGRTFPEEKENL